MTGRVTLASPEAPPGSARCPAPIRPRRCVSSPVSCPSSRTFLSCPIAGPGADLTGRTAALLVDMAVEVTPRGWRLADRPGRDLARARSMLSSDLDVLEEVLDGFRGPVKIQLCGPWTLAADAGVAAHDERGRRRSRRGGRPDRLAGRRRGRLRGRRGQARTRGAAGRPVRRALAARRGGGQVPTASGLSRLAAVEAETLRDRLEQVLASDPRLHDRALLCSLGPVRDNQGGGGRRRRLRPRPATAGGRGRAWPSPLRRAWDC